MKKRILSVFLTLALILGVFPAGALAAEGNGLVDDEMKTDILKYFDSFEYDMEANPTRLEMAKVLAGLAGLEVDTENFQPPESTFTDTNTLDTKDQAILYAAVDANLIMGHDDGSFGPDGTVTRAQTARLLHDGVAYCAWVKDNTIDTSRYLNGVYSYGEDSPLYSDIKSHWAGYYINTLSMLEILNGRDGKFSPDDLVTWQDTLTWAKNAKIWMDNGAPTNVLKKSMFEVDTQDVTYAGAPVTPAVTAKDDLADENYTVTYTNNNKAGTASITIEGVNSKGYMGTLTYTFQILPGVRALTPANSEITVYVGGGNKALSTLTDNAAAETPTYIYESSNEKVATVDAQGIITPAAVGTTTITVTAPATANYAAGSASITVKVETLPQQELSFAADTLEKTYGDSSFSNALTNSSEGGASTFTYASSDSDVAVVQGDGTVTIWSAGTTTITATAPAVEGKWAETKKSYTLTVKKKDITLQAADVTTAYGKSYELKLEEPVDLVGNDDMTNDLRVELAIESTGTPDVGEYPISIKKISESKKYNITVKDGGTLTITKGTYSGVKEASTLAKSGSTAAYDLSALVVNVKDAGLALGSITDTGNLLAKAPTAEDQPLVSLENTTLTFTMADNLDQSTIDTVSAQVTVSVSSKNYSDFDLTLTIRGSLKDVPTVSVTPIVKTYDGKALTGEGISGTASVDGKSVAGTWSFSTDDQPPTTVSQSGVYNVFFTPTNTDSYETMIPATLSVTINKALLTVTATSQRLTVGASNDDISFAFTVTGLVGNEKLKESANYEYGPWVKICAVGTNDEVGKDTDQLDLSKAGTYDLVPFGADTGFYGVSEATDLTTQAIAENYEVKYVRGTLTIAARSTSSGGSSSSSSSATTTKTTRNPDGSTTKTVTNTKTGTVTETTTMKDGSTKVVETQKDGIVTETIKNTDGSSSEIVNNPDGSFTAKVTTTGGVTSESAATAAGDITATVTIPGKAVKDGEAVTLPVSEVTADRNIIIVKAEKDATVVVPVKDMDAGTVAVAVDTDGKETVIMTSLPTEKGISLAVKQGSKTIKIIDNSKDFDDVEHGNWAEKSITFVSAREMLKGTGDRNFSPAQPMTRAMLMTVLARYDGTDTEGGVTWYEKGMKWAVDHGVSDGTNPDASITREQLATMLYRYAGEPETRGTTTDFSDGESISDFARTAIVWCIEQGIINGKDGNILAPQDTATRAEVSTMLMRYCQRLSK